MGAYRAREKGGNVRSDDIEVRGAGNKRFSRETMCTQNCERYRVRISFDCIHKQGIGTDFLTSGWAEGGLSPQSLTE